MRGIYPKSGGYKSPGSLKKVNGKYHCPFCKSKSTTKNGFFTTKHHGRRQRYICTSCRKTFY